MVQMVGSPLCKSKTRSFLFLLCSAFHKRLVLMEAMRTEVCFNVIQCVC